MTRLPTLLALTVLASLATTAHATLVGDAATTFHTVEDNSLSGGQQSIFGIDSAAISDPGIDASGLFGTGLLTSPEFVNGGLGVAFDAGTGLTNRSVSANVDLPIAHVPLTGSLAFLLAPLMALLVIRRKKLDVSSQVD